MIEKVVETHTWTIENTLTHYISTGLLLVFLAISLVALLLNYNIRSVAGRFEVTKIRRPSISRVVAVIGVGATVFGYGGYKIGEGAFSYLDAGDERVVEETVEYVVVSDLTIESNQIAGESFFSSTPKSLWIITEEYEDVTIEVHGDAVQRLMGREQISTGDLYCADDGNDVLKCYDEKRYDMTPDNRDGVVETTTKVEEY